MSYERVLITGASGFVGTRLAEHLRLGRGFAVRGTVHEPARAVRLARLDVELVRADLADKASLEAALEGCDAVVHCAYGTSGGARERRRLTGAATARLAELARRHGVKRFVHLSSAAVWGFRPPRREIDERVPLPRRVGHPYCDGKLDAERGMQIALERGLPAVILRPTNVFGPWAPAFTVAPVEALREGRVARVGDGAGPANTVYVDNLIAAIVCALESDRAVGETYVVSDDDSVTWLQLYEAYATLVGSEIRTMSLEEYRRLRRPHPGRFVRSFASELAAVAGSRGEKGLLAAAAEQPTLRRLGRYTLRLVPGAAERVRGLAPPLSVTVPALPSPELVDLQTSGVRFRADKARSVLGWSPPVDFEEALSLTAEWLRFARLA